MTEPIPAAPAAIKPVFEDCLDEIHTIIKSRRFSWTLLSYLEWEEVAQLILIRVWQKWHLYDPAKSKAKAAKKLEHWVNKLITHQLANMKRQLLDKHARPCVGGGTAYGKTCAFNLGGDACAFTPSGKQCAECPAYAEWKRAKESLHNIKASVALEHHAQEVNNIQSDFMDIEGAKRVIDARMLERLSKWEQKVYRFLYIDHLTPIQTSARLKELAAKRKTPLKPTDPVDYQLVLRASKEMKAQMIDIIKTEDL